MTPYYSQDGITIYHGDCREVLPELPLYDLLLTDPPFFMPAQHYASRAQWQRSWGDTSILSSWWGDVVEKAVMRLNQSGHVITFCDDESYPVFYPSLYRNFDLLTCLVWDKGAIGMGTAWRHSHELLIAARKSGSKWVGPKNLSDVLRVSKLSHSERFHPVDKPTELLSMLIEPTTEAGDLVVDAFMGGGSTLVAAKDLGRRAIGIEIEERYCEIAAKRLAQGVLTFEER